MGSAQGRITIRRRPKDGNNGIDGKPGDDAVVYEIVTNVDTLRITDEDVQMSVRITKGSEVTVVDNYDAVKYYGLTFTAKIDGKNATGYIDATEDDSQIYWGGSLTLTKTSVLRLYLWKDGVCVAEKVLNVVADGVDGIDGEPGDNAVVYEIVTNVDTLRLSNDYVDVLIRITDGSTTKDESLEFIQENHGLTLTAKIDNKDISDCVEYTNDSQIYWGGSGIKLTKTSRLDVYLWKNDVCLAQKSLNVVADGEQGIQGIQGCILRTTEWVSGTEYRNDEALTSGTRFIDIVVIKNGNTGEVDAIYMCKKTHTASDANKPDGTSNTYWNKFNTFAPIYTPMIFADKALLRISQTNQLLVADDDGNVIGVFGGGRYPLQVGDYFKVDQSGKAYMTEAEISGKVTAGDADGQRVEIQPDNKMMVVKFNQEVRQEI